MGSLKVARSFKAGLLFACVAGFAGLGTPALAGERLRDHVYSDSYGNLVVYSSAGYKRIVVGQGHLAKKLAAETGAALGEPKVVYLDENDAYYVADCYRPPVFVKGRSYMYGLADGEMPVLSGCARR
ncbi:hypothetical protein [Arvimicrobium flavum]|uniref:hypothetical protein n=1 Tax=Arvimicrobium flavum TaxID=3393320 RepID=UPI00237BA55A|nr:hypothetical protein [Mesorhizobium shangrilense]